MPQRPGRQLRPHEMCRLTALVEEQNDRRHKDPGGADYMARDRYLAQLNDDGVSTRTLGAFLNRSPGTISQSCRKGRKATP